MKSAAAWQGDAARKDYSDEDSTTVAPQLSVPSPRLLPDLQEVVRADQPRGAAAARMDGGAMKTSAFQAYEGNREGWANAILEFLQPHLAELGISMPEGRTVRIGVMPLSRGMLGRCFSSKLSQSGTVNFIGICTKQAEPAELVHTLIHEYIHAADDCQSGHRNRWARWAGLLGMKAKGHQRNSLGNALILDALMAVGIPVQHEPSNVMTAGQSVPSQIRVECCRCTQHAYIPRRAFADGYELVCGSCDVIMAEARK